MESPDNRRPIKARASGWAHWMAAALARGGAMPDLISATSVAFAILGAMLLLGAGVTAPPALRAPLLIIAGGCIQLRLLCNLLDGMVAVEHGRGSPAGPIWNELPDRIADALFLVGAGYGAARAGLGWAADLGWAAAILAVLTAYVRELGRGLGQPADFCGPGAKPHRMALLTLVTVVAAVAEPTLWPSGWSLAIGLALISLLAAVTLVRRTLRLAARLAVNSGS